MFIFGHWFRYSLPYSVLGFFITTLLEPYSESKSPTRWGLPATKHHMQILKQLHWNKDLPWYFIMFWSVFVKFLWCFVCKEQNEQENFQFLSNLTKALQTAVQSLKSRFQPSCFRICKRCSTRYIFAHIFLHVSSNISSHVFKLKFWQINCINEWIWTVQ